MKETIKIGYIGLGRRGFVMLKNCFSEMKDVTISAICDQHMSNLKKTEDFLLEQGFPKPMVTQDYHDILNDTDIDAVVIMTGWEGRAAIAIDSMKANKYTAIEVGCAFDLEECYQLIETYEATGVPLMMLENCCYGRREMMTLNVIKQGLFGDIIHCAGGYHHSLPKVELFPKADEDYKHYRLDSYINRNCEQYPTHELGPISKVLNINRGNRMLTLSSFASRGGALKEEAKRILGEDSPYAKIEYKQGDIITTVITCAGGETIHLCLDTTAPRPYYSRNFTVRGTKGMYTEERKVLYFAGMEEGIENNEQEMFEKYDHPLHKEYALLGERGGHDGMDWLVCRAFVEAVKKGTNTPIDAYDTVSWMAIAPLSELSIKKGGAPVEIPDFTNGKWRQREEIIPGKYCLDEICADETTSIF